LSKSPEGVNAIEKAALIIEELKNVEFSNATNDRYKGLNRYNIGVIRGGLGEEYSEWRVPQLPDKCTLKVALRYAPSQTKESMTTDLQKMLDEMSNKDKEFVAKINQLNNTPSMGPFEIDENEKIVTVVKDAHQKVTGSKPKIGDIEPYKYY